MDLPVVPAQPVRWRTGDAVLVLVAAQLSSVLWAGLALAAVYGGHRPEPLPISALVLLNIGLWIGYGAGTVAVVKTKGRDLRSDLGAGLERWDLLAGLALGIVVQALVLPTLYWPIGRVVDGDPTASARELVASARGPFAVLLLTLATVAMAPLVEELFFRGLLLRALTRRFGPLAGVVGSSALFALVHRQGLAFPGLFLFGVVSAGLALRTGRLGPSWGFHVGFNLTTLALLGLR
jgi:uncharacterized protein